MKFVVLEVLHLHGRLTSYPSFRAWARLTGFVLIQLPNLGIKHVLGRTRPNPSLSSVLHCP